MSIQALGYMGVRSRSVEDWAGYGTRQLGLQLGALGPPQLSVRVVEDDDLGHPQGRGGGRQLSRTHPPELLVFIARRGSLAA